MAVNKPSGLLSVPWRALEHKDSVMTQIQVDFPQAESVHRLDMTTNGVLVVALTKATEHELKRQFRKREQRKTYIARVWEHPACDEGDVDLPLICDWPNRSRQNVCFDTGKAALTHDEVLSRDPDQSASVRLMPLTGRSHQLRVHMQSLIPFWATGFTLRLRPKPWRRCYYFTPKSWPSPIPITARRFISIARRIFKLNRRSCFATAVNSGHDMPNLGAPCPAHPGAAGARRLALGVIYRLAKALSPL